MRLLTLVSLSVLAIISSRSRNLPSGYRSFEWLSFGKQFSTGATCIQQIEAIT
jgi:hypothetical protein